MGRISTNPGVLCPSIGRGTGDGDPLVAPIAQSTTFRRTSVGTNPPHQYSRVSNPSVSDLEAALGELENALPAACFTTGLAAETALFLATLRAGDHVVCGRSCYGGTTRLLQQVLSGLGIQATFVDSTNLVDVRRAIRPATRLIFVETPANPTLDLTDIRACASIAREAGALLAVDNTFLTPVLQQPLDIGADASVYSTTKFIDGHSVALGGALVTRDEQLLEQLRFIRKCTGAIQTPFDAWLTTQGLKTLPLRIRRQSESAAAIAPWLAQRPEIRSVYHPSLARGRARDIADSQHLGDESSRHGAVVTFEIRGGLDAGRAFVEALQLCTLAEHVGSLSTLITHPATMTHADVPPAQRREAGITDGLLRLSVGIEPVEAIIDDLAQALQRAARTSPQSPASSKEVTPCASL